MSNSNETSSTAQGGSRPNSVVGANGSKEENGKRRRADGTTAKTGKTAQPKRKRQKRQKRDALPIPEHPRPVMLRSVEEGNEVMEEATAGVWPNIERAAKKHLDAEAQQHTADRANYRDEFLAMAEFVLGIAARQIFQGKCYNKLTVSQAVRIQEPFRLFCVERMYTGDLDKDALAAGNRPPSDIFHEIYRGRDEGADESAPATAEPNLDEPYVGKHSERLEDILAKTMNWTTTQYPCKTKDGQPSLRDPRTFSILLTNLSCRRVQYYVFPQQLTEANIMNPMGKPWRCCLTGRQMNPGDVVRAVRLTFRRKPGGREEDNGDDGDDAERASVEISAGATSESSGPFLGPDGTDVSPESKNQEIHIRVGVLDHAPLARRQAEMGVPKENITKGSQFVSTCGIRILTFVTAHHWLWSEIAPSIRESMASEAAIKSYETLEKQRRRPGSGSSTLVAKKNKPDKLEERIMAWRDFAFSPTGVRRMVELFGKLKTMQIGFVRDFKELQSILVAPES